MSRRVTLYTIVSVVCLALLYVLFLVMRSHAVVVLVTAHCLSCLVSLLIAIAGTKKLRSDTPLFIVIASERNKTLEIVSICSIAFGGIASVLLIIISTLISRLSRRSLKENSFRLLASMRLGNAVLVPSICSFLYIFAIYIVAYFNFDNISLLKIVTGSILVSVLLRHVSYIMSGASVRRAIRRTHGNVYVLFAVLSCADFISIVLSSNSFLNWHDSIASIHQLYAVATGLLLGNLIDIFKYTADWSLAPVDIVVFAFIGAIFNATIVDGLYKIQQFRRNDDDHIAISSNFNQIGRYSEAIEILRNVKKRNIAFLYSRSAAYIGLEMFEAAWHDAIESNEQSKVEYGSPTLSDNLRFGSMLINVLGTIQFNNTTVCRLFTYCVHRSLDDAIIASIIEGVYLPKRPIESIDQLFPVELRDSSHPFCSTVSALLINDTDGARQSLITITPKGVTEKSMYFRFALGIVLFDQNADPKSILDAYDSISDLFFKYTTEIDIANCNDFEKGTFYATTFSFKEFAKRFESRHQERWQYVVNQLLKYPKLSDPSIAKVSANLSTYSR